MGWTFCRAWTTVREAKAAILEEVETNGYNVLGKAGGKHFWLALERGGKKFVTLFLMEKQGGEWGYKEITEAEGPAYYDCPTKLLDLCPVTEETNEWARNWRQKVLEYHVRAKQTFEKGARVQVFGRDYTVVGPYKRGTFLIKDEKGEWFKAKPANMVAL